MKFGETGIIIFAVQFHTHHGELNKALPKLKLLISGQYQEVRHYRNNEVIRVLRYNHYDYKYQPLRRLRVPIHLSKEEQIAVICHTDSNKQTKSFTVMAIKRLTTKL